MGFLLFSEAEQFFVLLFLALFFVVWRFCRLHVKYCRQLSKFTVCYHIKCNKFRLCYHIKIICNIQQQPGSKFTKLLANEYKNLSQKQTSIANKNYICWYITLTANWMYATSQDTCIPAKRFLATLLLGS